MADNAKARLDALLKEQRGMVRKMGEMEQKQVGRGRGHYRQHLYGSTCMPAPASRTGSCSMGMGKVVEPQPYHVGLQERAAARGALALPLPPQPAHAQAKCVAACMLA